MSQSDDLAEDLKSMSFGSTDRSGSVSSGLSRSTSAATVAALGKLSDAAGGDAPSSCREQIYRRRAVESGRELLSPSDLRFVRRLGSGDIGTVYLAEVRCRAAAASAQRGGVESAAAPCAVAVKVMDKRELSARNKKGRAKTERDILESLDHPFLPRLYGCAESELWSCLLTEFCPGGDLHVLRQRQTGKRFDEAAVR